MLDKDDIRGLLSFADLAMNTRFIEPYSEGRNAKRDRKSVHSCPYPAGPNRTKWMKGFHSKVEKRRVKKKFSYKK